MQATASHSSTPAAAGGDPINSAALAQLLLPRWRTLLGAAVVCGTLGAGGSFLIPPTYTARTSFVSPQQQQGAAAAALASLSSLSSIAGAAAGIRSPAEQYVTILQSVTVANRIIGKFELQAAYDEKYLVDTRKELNKNVRITAGKKDNVIAIEVDDHQPQRAAAMANAYVDELRAMSNTMALTEAQQRRMFFERHLSDTRDRLTKAQLALQKSGFNAGVLKSEPRSAADTYARMKAEISATEVRIQALRKSLAEETPEVQRQLAVLSGLRAELAKLEQPADQLGSEDYVGAYREYKYQEALFEVYSRQFELAKLDESREGTLFQVIDVASAPEKKSKPVRSLIAAASTVVGAILAAAVLVLRQRRRTAS